MEYTKAGWTDRRINKMEDRNKECTEEKVYGGAVNTN
jgi:hypothetical protein